jgi:hypothetical protein
MPFGNWVMVLEPNVISPFGPPFGVQEISRLTESEWVGGFQIFDGLELVLWRNGIRGRSRGD